MSSNPRPQLKSSSLKRVNADTRFYVDYEWWDKSNIDLKTYLFSRLGIGQEAELDSETDEIDMVDPSTGEVRRVDGFQYMIQSYFTELPTNFFTQTSFVDAVFCVLLANANQPMTAREIAGKVEKPVSMVIRTLGGSKVYQGIRPILEDG
ncbi:MAG: hypothetical protein CSB13_02880 [Chloroflexi bacterium]|nr:MAG: hypothetical protein CSB13_02880 [Chloroflexota bacterium]